MKTIAAVIAFALRIAVTNAGADDGDLIDADRPGIADGSRTVKHGRFQIENGVDREHLKTVSSDERSFSVPLLLRYGISDRFEARAESNTYERVQTRTAGRRETATGWNPVSLGFKDHLFERENSQRRSSLGVIGRWFFPSGSGEFRSDHSHGDVRLAADLEFGEHWLVNPNIGIASRSEGGVSTSGTGALTLQYNFTHKSNVFIDGGVQHGEEKGAGTTVLLDAGAAWIVGNNAQLDVSVGWGAHGRNAPNVFWSAGLSRRF